MVIAITHRGIDRHTVILEEEKKQLRLLRESLQQLETAGRYDITADCAAIRTCLDDIEKLERNVEGRMDFLNRLNEDTRMLEKRTKEKLEGLETRNG